MKLTWANFRDERIKRGKPFVVAHRGVPHLAPENTLRSFELALQQGAFALETDLHFSIDDEIILHHDPTLERMTGKSGTVREHTAAELVQMPTLLPDTGESNERQFGSDTIPTLRDLLTFTNAETPLLLELKDPLFAQPKYAALLIDLLTEHNLLEQSAIISFTPALTAAVAQVSTQIPTGHITLKDPLPRRGIELLGPAFPLLYLNPLYVWWAHRMGAVVCPLDTTPEKRMNYYLHLGVDAVLADNPAAAIAAIESIEQRHPSTKKTGK